MKYTFYLRLIDLKLPVEMHYTRQVYKTLRQGEILCYEMIVWLICREAENKAIYCIDVHLKSLLQKRTQKNNKVIQEAYIPGGGVQTAHNIGGGIRPTA